MMLCQLGRGLPCQANIDGNCGSKFACWALRAFRNLCSLSGEPCAKRNCTQLSVTFDTLWSSLTLDITTSASSCPGHLSTCTKHERLDAMIQRSIPNAAGDIRSFQVLRLGSENRLICKR